MSSMNVISFRRQYIWSNVQGRQAKTANPLKIFMINKRVILTLIAYFKFFYFFKQKKT